jgi:hypothetical protein
MSTPAPLFTVLDDEPRTAQEDDAHQLLCDGCTCQDKNGLQHPKGCQRVVKVQFSAEALHTMRGVQKHALPANQAIRRRNRISAPHGVKRRRTTRLLGRALGARGASAHGLADILAYQTGSGAEGRRVVAARVESALGPN